MERQTVLHKNRSRSVRSAENGNGAEIRGEPIQEFRRSDRRRSRDTSNGVAATTSSATYGALPQMRLPKPAKHKILRKLRNNFAGAGRSCLSKMRNLKHCRS